MSKGRTVVVPDPDNERGMMAVDLSSGRVIARGYLELVSPSAFDGATEVPGSTTPRIAAIVFVEQD